MSDLEQIKAASDHLVKLRFPELPRPPISHDEPPTAKLVAWGSRMYCYSLLAHFCEMLGSFLTLAEMGLVPASFVIARCLFEMAAHAYYTDKHVKQFMDQNDIQSAWDFLVEINMGSQYMKEEYGERPEEWPQFAAPRHIAKVIRTFEEWTAKNQAAATTEYSFLSEFAHPNMAAFSHYYKMERKGDVQTVVTFIEPPREISQAPLPYVSLSILACLFFTHRHLQRTGESDISPQIARINPDFAPAP